MCEPNPDLKRRYDSFMAVPEQRHRYQMLCLKFPVLNMVDNNFAYHSCLQNKYKMFENCKVTNFVPTYDKWCLYCDDRGKPKRRVLDVNQYSSVIQPVKRKPGKFIKNTVEGTYFGTVPVVVILLPKLIVKIVGTSVKNVPVKFCSPKCRERLYADHKMIDCDYFAKTFNGLQNN